MKAQIDFVHTKIYGTAKQMEDLGAGNAKKIRDTFAKGDVK